MWWSNVGEISHTITGCIGSCHFDNFRCSQWWNRRPNDDFSVSVWGCMWLTLKLHNTNVPIYIDRLGTPGLVFLGTVRGRKVTLGRWKASKVWKTKSTSNGSWCIGIKGEMSGTVCVTFTWDIYIYIWVVYSFCLFCCLFIIVTWWYMWCIVWQVASKRKYRHVW